MSDPNRHENLHLLAVERTGWRRWIFGRWAYSSEPFRRDIQRKCAACDMEIPLHRGERLYPPSDRDR